MRSWMALLAVIPACGFHSSSNDGGGGGSGNPDALYCYGTFVRVCFFTPPSATVMLNSSTNIDTDATDTSSMCDQHNDQMSRYCVVAGTTFTLMPGKKITAYGSKPLILLSTTMIDLSGSIDVSSRHMSPELKGAGAAPSASCPSVTEATGSSGGYGGSFGGKGGDGADGNPDDGLKGAAATIPTTFPTVLRGGCPGGDSVGGGAGGAGGGAVAIVAAMIHLDGGINASGAGGHAGLTTNKSGGGGGGAGGMIVLDSPTLLPLGLSASLWASGGGGGQGGAAGTAGVDGGESSGPILAAAGGNEPSAAGGRGGNGSVTSLNGESPPNNAKNGGGGGGGAGGAGFIHAPGIIDPTIIFPPSTDP